MDIAYRIKLLRLENNLSQATLAKILSVSAGNIGDWERRRSRPSSKALLSLCDYFKVSQNWLLYGDSKYINGQDKNSAGNIGIRLEFALFVRNISKFKLSKHLNIETETIDKIFWSKFPEPQIFNSICEELNITPEWLLGYKFDFRLDIHNNSEPYYLVNCDLENTPYENVTFMINDIINEKNLPNNIETRILMCKQFIKVNENLYNRLNLMNLTELILLYNLSHIFKISLGWLISGRLPTKSMVEIETRYDSYINDLASADSIECNTKLIKNIDTVKIDCIDNCKLIENKLEELTFSKDEISLLKMYRKLPDWEKEFFYNFLNFRMTKQENTKSINK